jgi:hypothetical protein
MIDPAEATVRLNTLARELNNLMSPCGSPDFTRIVEVTTDIRAQAGAIRGWVFDKQDNRDV